MKSNMSTMHQINNYIVNKLKTTYFIADKDAIIQKIEPEYFIQDIPIKELSFLKIKHNFKYQCVSCARETKKIYSGFCYICLIKKPEADTCIMSPHRCHYHMGTCRAPEFGESFCYQPHYVYLAFTDKYKIGLTRHNQIPTRWIDQGATLASPFLKTHSRHQAGVIEKFLTQKLSDRSQWQNMLKMKNFHPPLEEFQNELQLLKTWIVEHERWQSNELHVDAPTHLNIQKEIIFLPHTKIFEILYPFSSNLIQKFHSIKLEKSSEIEGQIHAVKGQYIIFNHGSAINFRNHSGFIVDIECKG